MKLKALGYWSLALACAGCAVGPDYRPPAAVAPGQAAFSPAAGVSREAPVDAWWQTFGDATLDQLVARALRQNLDLAAARARIEQARALLGVVQGGELPRVNAAARESHDNLSVNSEGFANVPRALIPHPQHRFTDDRIGLDASWEIDLFGYTARSTQAAAARLGGAEEAAHAVALSIGAEVASGYIDYRLQQGRLALARRNLQLAGEQQRLTGLLWRAGLVSQLEVEAAGQAVRTASAQLPGLQAAARADLDRLTLLLGLPPRALDAELAAAMPLPDPVGTVGVGLPSELLQRRPDIRRAERDLAAASAEVGVAVAAQYPRFTLTGSLGFDAIHQGQLTDFASRYWSFGPSLSLPLFAGGSLKSQVRASEAAYEAALAGYRRTVLAALADTETALIRVDRETARLADLSAARQSAGRNLQLTGRRFAVGEVAQLEVLQADRQVQQADDAWLQSRAARLQDLVGLYKALGGGWQPAGAGQPASGN